MNTQKMLTFIMLNSIVVFSYASTVYQFDRGAIQKHTEQELRSIFEPLTQKAAIQDKLEKYNNALIVGICNDVHKKHLQIHFKTQKEAKEYATDVAKMYGIRIAIRLAKRQAAQELTNAPRVLKKAVKQEIKKYIRDQANLSLSRSGRITPVLQTMQEEVEAQVTRTINNYNQEIYNWARR